MTRHSMLLARTSGRQARLSLMLLMTLDMLILKIIQIIDQLFYRNQALFRKKKVRQRKKRIWECEIDENKVMKIGGGYLNTPLQFIRICDRMQEKIQKIFSYFGNIKNEPFYTSCISQVVEIYEGNPEALKFILFNLNQLIFSTCKDVRLRLKHRLITASLISKLNHIYSKRVRDFMEDKLNFELQNFQLDTLGINSKTEAKMGAHSTVWQQIDIFKLVQNKPLLYSSRGREQFKDGVDTKEQEKVFDSFLDMNHATMLNIQNVFKDVSLTSDVTQEVIKKEALKYRNKADKISRKNEEQMNEVSLSISNPFNLMYEICINNILNTQWELRHLSVLILKELLLNSDFLGFTQSLVLSAKDSRQNRFLKISELTRDSLRQHVKNLEKRRQLIDDIIYRNIHLLSLDRFADYQTEESVILIRMVSAEVLSICFRDLDPKRQATLIKMIRKVFERDTPFNKDNKRFTWQIKHSFLYFLKVLLADDDTLSKQVCMSLEECFIKMLAHDQVDEITLCICSIIEHFIGQPFFNSEKVDRMNRQIWAIVQNMDDLSVSAKDTLSLLVKLFPYFKLNEANCIDRLKKFFISKISEVRCQLYRLTGSLYSRKKVIDDVKVVQKNMVQLLQGALIESEPQNFKGVGSVMAEAMPSIFKQKNIRKLVQFINTCVTPHQYSEEIINSKFLMGVQREKSQYNSNEYLYIMEHENLHAPISAYIDKRIWKMALTIRRCFEHSSDGLEELMRGIQKNNQRNHRAKTLIYLLLDGLLPSYKAQLKLFQEYRAQSQTILAWDFSQFTDNQIERIYLPELKLQFNSILENTVYQQQPESLEALGAIKEISEIFKKNQAVGLKNGMQLAKKLSIFYAQPLNPVFLGQIQMLLRIFNSVMKIQRQSMKNVKILALRYLIKFNVADAVSNLNVVIKCIMQSIKEDPYGFLSEATAEAAAGLSLWLMKNKKAVFNKFNNNLCTNVSTNYEVGEMNLKEGSDSIRLEGDYMGGMCRYIQIMGSNSSDFLKETWKYYLEELQGKKNCPQEYNRLLTLLTGVINPLLSVDLHPLEGPHYFVSKCLNKLKEILQSVEGQLKQSIILKVKVILQKMMRYLSANYRDISNIFFEWFLGEMESENLVVFQVIQKVSGDNLIEIAPVASLFILQIIRSISKVSLHEVAMNSLSNLIVGVYTNIQKTAFSPALQVISDQGVEFIKNFKNTSNFNYQLQINFHEDISLRAYQQEGITWLGFLTRYNLSGALCDDMGLGKTLQILAVMENEYMRMGEVNLQEGYLHSLIICPNTLMQHWAFEYRKYFPKPYCEIFVIDNKKKFPQVLKKQKANRPYIFITGYSLIEKNEGIFDNLNMKFIVLDEGHLIKNVKTLKFKAIKKLRGLHRFILTGTPIQNRLIQLWGLFDFLMPGYLYSEQLFKKHYQKLFEVNLTTFREDDLLFSDEQRRTLQKLHYKVMPFIMRRMKSDVLKQIPQKIINDHHCELSGSQIKHYSDLQQRIRIQHENKNITALKNLHQMIHIVNHPYLADLQNIVRWQDSGKFVALGEIFENIGLTDKDLVSQNKVIIFAREKATIDLIGKYLHDLHPDLFFTKLTSDVKESERFTVAQTFNGDSDIKVLLVTKAIGGVGLNLSSANIIVMFDSDFNPTVDMQAIDRAHRIGQKRVLNVYRLITKFTLEEKIMGIQKFKIGLANSIVNMDNASIKNIKDSHLPDLLQNVRDIVKEPKEDKVNNSMLNSLVTQMEKSAIETNQFFKKY